MYGTINLGEYLDALNLYGSEEPREVIVDFPSMP
jgi:hypothetical protein